MSLWTPDGERPIRREPDPEPAQATPAGAAAVAGLDPEDLTPEQQAEMQAMAAEMAEVRQQLASVPAAVVVANHAMGLYELAAIHLGAQPPNLPESKVAIDAFGALLGAVEGRLGPDEPTLQDALNQLRLAYVQVQGPVGGSPAGGTPNPGADAGA